MVDLFNFVPPALKPPKKTPPKPPKKTGPATYTDAMAFSNLGGASRGTPTIYNRPTLTTPVLNQAGQQVGTTQVNPVLETARHLGITGQEMYGMLNAPGQAPAAAMGNLMGGNSGGGGRAGGGGGGGGPQVTQAMADQLFAFNADPYAKWRAGIEEQYRFNPQPYEAMVGQANAYNPDFAGMETEAVGRVNAGEQARAAEVQRRMEMIQSLTNQVGQGYATNMQSALRDLAGQGIDTGQYVNQAAAAGANLAAGGANQVGLGGNLDRIAMQNQGDTIRGMNMVRQGGEAQLANNRGTLLNQIATQRAGKELELNQARAGALGQVGVAEAQAQMALEQAKRQFMLQYGL